MKKILFLLLTAGFLQPLTAQQTMKSVKTAETHKLSADVATDVEDRNNNFYDNAPTYHLPLSNLTVEGEIENPGPVDFSKLTKRSVIVKETLFKDGGSDQFTGAFRYDGYSLFDILNERYLKKLNAEDFKPIIDLFVVIENDKGERAVFSWGEIYYPNVLHDIIIATDVMRIVPSKTNDLWVLPKESKVVSAHDLITERNISSPTNIVVISYPRKYEIRRDLSPMVNETVNFFSGETHLQSFTEIPPEFRQEILHTIFYGRGRGIHSTQPFTGVPVRDYVKNSIKPTRETLRNGMVVFAGMDGYRAVFSLSEIMNRNDQAQVLIVPCPGEKDGGNFRIFPPADFFSDRAVKALCEIRIEVLKP